MARTPSVRIQGWGTPPEPQPTGWDAIRAELIGKPGRWANLGELAAGTARKLASDRLTRADGFEVRIVPGDVANRVTVWARHAPADAPAPEPEPVETRAPKK